MQAQTLTIEKPENLTFMVPAALKLPLWNAPPNFSTSLVTHKDNRISFFQFGEKTPYGHFSDPGRRTTYEGTS